MTWLTLFIIVVLAGALIAYDRKRPPGLGRVAVGLTLLFFTLSFASEALSSSGGRSPKDLCHKGAGTKVRHRHIPETDRAGWICNKDGSFTEIRGSGAHKWMIVDRTKPAVPKPKEPTKAELKQRIRELEGRVAASERHRVEAADRSARTARDLRNRLSGAQADARNAKRLEDVAMAKLRAVVNGTPVCVHERAALKGKVDAGVFGRGGWRDTARRLEECLAAGE